eukprot:TRINITY_DN7419_c0_g1_i1.p1 TRINITY_DN7419_c0_g1~~TRINITY_DN7419_c0_g1_i1.p1  ORF type:complete len:302 (+),score=32.65 TRINITY_DN7419_c0_g1_i1:105-1010(+)
MGLESVIFFVYAAVSLLFVLVAISYSRRRKSYVSFKINVLLYAIMFIENLLVGISALVDEDSNERDWILRFRFGAQQLIIPVFLIALYEQSYLVHKRRSIPFCCIAFNAQHRKKNCMSETLRFGMWALAGVLAGITVILDHDFYLNPGDDPSKHGESIDLDESREWGIIIPPACLFTCSLYIGYALWQYGTHYSFKVHSTIFNTWFFILFGSAVMAVSRIIYPNHWDYPFIPNFGELFLGFAIIRTIPLVDLELQQVEQFADHLKKGRTNSITCRVAETAAGNLEQLPPSSPNKPWSNVMI